MEVRSTALSFRSWVRNSPRVQSLHGRDCRPDPPGRDFRQAPDAWLGCRCIASDVDALDLIQLGRSLARIGEQSLRGTLGVGFPTGPSLVVRDVFPNPGVSIYEIAERRVLPQSYVSESVAKLRGQGLLVTEVDPDDKRRTLIRINPQHTRSLARKGARPVDWALADALGAADPEAMRAVLGALDVLAARIRPGAPGVIIGQLRKTPSRATEPQPTADA
ncbi:MAG: helix-turn-helix domain-containing protein [Candidatus Dormiibacterota bacterium]